MGFLIRSAIILGIIIFLIPVDESALPPAAVAEEPAPVDALEAAEAARLALDDVGGFCGRNPDVCEVGGRVAHTFALKARTGALWLYAALDRQLGGSGEPPVETGSTERGTLTPEDLEPAWNGPEGERPVARQIVPEADGEGI